MYVTSVCEVTHTQPTHQYNTAQFPNQLCWDQRLEQTLPETTHRQAGLCAKIAPLYTVSMQVDALCVCVCVCVST